MLVRSFRGRIHGMDGEGRGGGKETFPPPQEFYVLCLSPEFEKGGKKEGEIVQNEEKNYKNDF